MKKLLAWLVILSMLLVPILASVENAEAPKGGGNFTPPAGGGDFTPPADGGAPAGAPSSEADDDGEGPASGAPAGAPSSEADDDGEGPASGGPAGEGGGFPGEGGGFPGGFPGGPGPAVERIDTKDWCDHVLGEREPLSCEYADSGDEENCELTQAYTRTCTICGSIFMEVEKTLVPHEMEEKDGRTACANCGYTEGGSDGDSSGDSNGEPAGEEPAGEEPAGEEPSGGEPAGGEPSGGEPAGEEPAGEEPAGEEPSGGEPSGGEPAGEEPAGEEPAGEEPAGEQPSGGEPSGGEPSGEEPAGEEPAGEEPAGEEPSGGEPSGGEPAGGEPAGEQPAGEPAGEGPSDGGSSGDGASDGSAGEAVIPYAAEMTADAEKIGKLIEAGETEIRFKIAEEKAELVADLGKLKEALDAAPGAKLVVATDEKPELDEKLADYQIVEGSLVAVKNPVLVGEDGAEIELDNGIFSLKLEADKAEDVKILYVDAEGAVTEAEAEYVDATEEAPGYWKVPFLGGGSYLLAIPK